MQKEKRKIKCGIVTLYDDNFGTCLQAFALFRSIEKLGYKPCIIKYVRGNKPEGNSSKLGKIKNTSLTSLVGYLISYKFYRDRKEGFHRFRNEFLDFSDITNYRNALEADLADMYDAFVCGSDMIWSEEFADDWDYFFLKFAPYDKRISYAPSFGKNEVSPKNRSVCKQNLEGIRYCSCREEAGVQLIKEQFGVQSKLVVDPTMLMCGSEWREIIKGKAPIINDKYYLTYVFGGIEGSRKRIFNVLDDKVELGNRRLIPMNRKQCNSSAVKGSLGPLEFLTLYRDASFIVTDTFHGLLFALIFEKPFVVLEREDGGHWAKYSDRMTSTLEMLGLENRYINSRTVIRDEFFTLDYSNINEILSQKRKDSLTFLGNSLREVTE